MKSSTGFRFSSSVFIFFVLFIVAAIAEEYSNAEESSTDTYLQADQCVYSMSVKTGNVKDAGTGSRISLKLGNGRSSSFNIPDLRVWGVMKPRHDYFVKGNLDFFVVTGPCLLSEVCLITVTSDGNGNKPGWYLEYVDITTTGPNGRREQNMFPVNQWLVINFAPFQLSTTRDKCGVSEGGSVEELDIATYGDR